MTNTPLRAFNRTGIERFRQYLDALRSTPSLPVPVGLLEESDLTVDLSVDTTIEGRLFITRWAAGRYLSEVMGQLPREEVDGNTGLWAWLSLFHFDQVCPNREGVGRTPGRDYRHIPDFSYRNQHRHLLLGPYQVYRRHHGDAILLLSGPLYSENKVYHEFASRRDLIVNRGIIDAANSLYLDRKRGLPKRGCQATQPVPGGVIRFIRVLQQLDLTYDIHGMLGADILELLPKEFEEWRSI